MQSVNTLLLKWSVCCHIYIAVSFYRVITFFTIVFVISSCTIIAIRCIIARAISTIFPVSLPNQAVLQCPKTQALELLLSFCSFVSCLGRGACIFRSVLSCVLYLFSILNLIVMSGSIAVSFLRISYLYLTGMSGRCKSVENSVRYHHCSQPLYND